MTTATQDGSRERFAYSEADADGDGKSEPGHEDHMPLMEGSTFVSIDSPLDGELSARQPQRRGRCWYCSTCLALLGLFLFTIVVKYVVYDSAVQGGDVVEMLPTTMQQLQEHMNLPFLRSSPVETPPEPTLGSRVVLTLKTGSSVLYHRLPAHLLEFERDRSLRPNLLLYSDWPLRFGDGWEVRDALQSVSEAVRKQKDFNETYSALKRVVEGGGKIEEFKDGWKLDRYKFLPLWDDAYRTYPNADWYVGTEADAFIFWKPLLKFLSKLDPSEHHIIGCPNILLKDNSLFANGGCSYVLSSSLMASTYGSSPTFLHSADDELEHACCGDAELSKALFRSPNVHITELSAAGGQRFQGAPPWEIVYDEHNWCEEVLSLHHLDAWTVAKLYGVAEYLDSVLPENDTVRFGDIYDHMMPAFLRPTLSSVHNAADNVTNTNTTTNATTTLTLPSHLSLPSSLSARKELDPLQTWTSATCSSACASQPDCFVWSFVPTLSPQDSTPDGTEKGACFHLDRAVAFGGVSSVERGGETSGYMVDRIQRFRAERWCADRVKGREGEEGKAGRGGGGGGGAEGERGERTNWWRPDGWGRKTKSLPTEEKGNGA